MKYICAMCGEDCESGWTEAEAVAELKRDFGDVPLEECDQICDVCYQQVSPQNNPEYHAGYLARNEHPVYFNTPLPTQIMLDDTEAFRAAIEAELTRKLAEWIDREIAEELLPS